jgi:hypothetical protein
MPGKVLADTSPQLGGDLSLNGKNLDFPTTANISDCLDEDNMASGSATKLATQQSIKAYADTKQAAMGADDNYVTDAEKIIIGNTSGTNTGNNATNSQYSGLVSNATHTGDVTGSVALVIAAQRVYASMFASTNAAVDLYTPVYDSSTGKCTWTAPVTKHIRCAIVDPNTAVTKTATICLIPTTASAITITRLDVSTSSASYEVAGDLKWADAFIGLANAAVIETFDTTSGVRSDSSIASGAVASGKCVYLSFDSAPNALMVSVTIDIWYTS